MTTQIKSLSTWSYLFHPTTGHYRQPHNGDALSHLDIDIRFVDETCLGDAAIHLPNVEKLTLRGGEYCQEDDERMEALAQVLNALNPVEVQW
jgi:hypothetical protein